MNFYNKKILFISPRFFNYEKAIINRLNELGAKVDFFDERPSNSVIGKGMIRVNPRFYQKKINDYYQSIENKTKQTEYDFFLLIKGESIPFSFLKNFNETHPKTQKILYTYDTVEEYPKFEILMKYFDKNISFEPNDCKKYNFLFRPLFYINQYRENHSTDDLKYDITFIGSAHSDRYIVGETIDELSKKLNLKNYFYYYSPSKVVYYYKKLFDKNFKKFNINKLSFNKLSHNEIAKIYDKSFSILDINKPFQFGLSMRTFETLASSKKLITTNQEIKYYPFYDTNNILIIDRENIEIDSDFFNSEFKPYNEMILYKISLDSWLEDVFLKGEIDYWNEVLNY